MQKDTPFWPKKKLHMLSNFGFRMLEFDLSNTERIFLTLENPYSRYLCQISRTFLKSCLNFQYHCEHHVSHTSLLHTFGYARQYYGDRP